MAISLSNNKGMADRTKARLRRQNRGRKTIAGSPDRPRLVVTRSARHIMAQVVDDTVGKTLASASTLEAEVRGAEGDKTAKAKKVGVEVVAFDRAGNKYHGRIAALADAAREAGLGF